MDEFEQARKAYQSSREAAEVARTQLIRAREQVRRLQRGAEALARRVNQGSGREAAAELHRLQGRTREAEAARERFKGDLKDAAAARLEALREFAAFTDPTRELERLADDTPIALFPLRLETRFKTVDGQRFLWVRVFPDDVLIDTFQPEIAETELENTAIYWTHKWRAGGDPEGHRAAWAALVKSHGAGRARWLTRLYAPLNADEEPDSAADQYILVVRPETPVPLAEKPVIGAFWERVWASAGLERDAAFADMEAALGGVRAAFVENQLAPVNLFDTAVKPDSPLTPVVVFLDLPDPETLPAGVSAEAWTRGATAWLLPERLVLLGFQDGQEVLRETGALIPPELQIGPDPSEDDEDQIDASGEDLKLPEAMRWTVDFEAAVAQGMGFAINLSERGLDPAFDRLFVLGVRVGDEAETGAQELETLIANHQAGRKGFELLPQGSPTNNTDTSRAGHSWWQDPDQSFAHFFESESRDDPAGWERRRDGAWLAGILGVNPALLRESPNYYGSDQAEARAMNIALWPATLGYYMEQMMEPVFSEEIVRETREFFNRFVVGRGTLPLVRIGRQPYGILPATVWSEMEWWKDPRYSRTAPKLRLPGTAYLDGLDGLLTRTLSLWQTLSRNVSQLGDPGPDPQQTLLDIVGLHPVSAEFYQRYSQTFTQYYNLLGIATEAVSGSVSHAARRYVEAGLLALAELGWAIPPDSELPEILEKIFLKQPNLLGGNLVEAELSETEALSATRTDGLNYIAWMQQAARISHDVLRKQEGFADGVPTALLYMMLRHALDLGFVDSGLRLSRDALQWSDVAYREQRKEPKFIQVAAQGDSDGRWAPLYRAEPAVTGDPVQRLGDFIPQVLSSRGLYLDRQLSALDVLKSATTGALERALVEHIDCLSYRLDAWRFGVQAVQLSYMRGESGEGFARTGIYVGAYGWLENVSASEGVQERVELDPELAVIFDGADQAPLMRDSDNYGHIHAPSLDHAVTAAILRNGHKANATPQSPDLLAVDLSSERVRLALRVIQGIRNGQSLGALLGYRLERALHDEPDLFLDRLIYDLRRAFPLVGNRNRKTRVGSLNRITKVEARNVVDGVAFMDHIAETGEDRYPYGLSTLPDLNEFSGPGLPNASELAAIIDDHVAHMRSIGDAVGDLGVAEGVYQVVRGNYERAAGALDAFSKGSHPPEPEVTATPRSGRTLTHRLGLHLEGSLSPADPANTTPRAKGEPALARWLGAHIPDPATVFARVTWRDADGVSDGSLTPSMVDLGLAPVDLFYILDAGGARDMPGFDDLLIDFAERSGAPAPRDDAAFELEYKPDAVPGLTVFEVAPLVRALRGLILGARPLRPTDLSLQNEAAAAQDAAPVVRSDKAQAVLADLQDTLAPIEALINTIEAATGDAVSPETARDAARDNVDQWIVDYAALVRTVAPFGLRAASLTTAVEGRRRRFSEIVNAVDGLIARWQGKQDKFTTVMDEYADLPAGAADEVRQSLLIRAARTVSTRVIAPLPPDMAGLELEIANLRSDFENALDDLRTLRGNAARTGAALHAVTSFLPVLQTIDHKPFDLTPFRDSLLALARELVQSTIALRDDVSRRVTRASDALARAAAAAGERAQTAAAEAAQALLGEAFVMLPEFTLSSDRLAEWDNVWGSRAGLLDHLSAGAEPTPFPIDDWLHGVARVRERPRQLEMAAMLGEALDAPADLDLEALQFPYRAHDAWLGLRFPDTFSNGDPFVLDEDKLLYSAHFQNGAEIDPAQAAKTYCGLMLDEWVEVIPTAQETSGLAFHFDRPSSEAPQAILLATPPVFRGSWRWQDLVNTLHETLDFAALRAVEPAQLDQTALAPLVPAVVSAVTVFPITAMLNFAINNQLHEVMLETGNE